MMIHSPPPPPLALFIHDYHQHNMLCVVIHWLGGDWHWPCVLIWWCLNETIQMIIMVLCATLHQYYLSVKHKELFSVIIQTHSWEIINKLNRFNDVIKFILSLLSINKKLFSFPNFDLFSLKNLRKYKIDLILKWQWKSENDIFWYFQVTNIPKRIKT